MSTDTLPVAQPTLTTIERLLLDVGAAIYVPVAPLAITAWSTTEPVGFEQRTSGVEAPIAIGQPWGKRLFDCAWMRFNATLPDDVNENGKDVLVARIDVNGELCIVDETGVPVRGLTNVKSTFDERLGGPAKTIYRLPKSMVSSGKIEFWGDAGFNDLFGFLKDDGAVALSEIALCRENVRQLYYDIETLRDYQLEILPTETRFQQINADIEAIAHELDCSNADEVSAARDRLRPWFHSADKDRLQVHAVGHAHLDLAWLWPIRETIRKGARTFASALYNIERYPEYIFGCSQPQLFAWMKEHYPALYSKIKDAVRAGKIEPQGTFWVEPDCNIPSGEAFVRQVLVGAKFFRDEFGIVPNYCWEPDVFGYNGQLPQILKKSGHDYFMTQKLSWNVVNRFGHQSFHWQGIDGTSILTHMLPEETYNSPGAARSLRKISTNYFERAVSDHALMVFGIGDGGGGPDAEHFERLRRAPGLPGLPAVKIQPAAEFFKTWSLDGAKFPTWKGELYLERHQGTLTTQSLAKRNNRRSEIALRELEYASFLAATHAGIAYPTEALDRLWKEVLLYQFHDILPGSSIKRVYDECNARYALILAEVASLTEERYSAVAAILIGSVKPDTVESASVPAAAAAQTRPDKVVFNSLAWPRREWFKLSSEGEGNANDVADTDANGSANPTWHRLDVPALGWSALPAAATTFAPGLIARTDLLENEFLRVQFNAEGRMVSFFDKRAARENLAAGEIGNDLVVIPDTGDAWDFETDHDKKIVVGYLSRGITRPTLHEAVATVDGPCVQLVQAWRVGSSEVRQTIKLFAGADRLEFDTEVNWQDPATMLRVRFPVSVIADEARFEIPFGSLTRSTKEDTSVRLAQMEVAAQQWIDLSEESHGVTLFNDCKYGFRVKGHTLDMTLLRCVPHPGAPLIGKDDRPDRSAAAVYGDLGAHSFRYALQPHAGPVNLAAVTATARLFNTPVSVAALTAEWAGAADRDAGDAPHFILSSPAIELAALKRAEDDNGWILRLVNVTEKPVEVSVDAKRKGRLQECDLSERTAANSHQTEGSENVASLALNFSQFEIKTLRFTSSD